MAGERCRDASGSEVEFQVVAGLLALEMDVDSQQGTRSRAQPPGDREVVVQRGADAFGQLEGDAAGSFPPAGRTRAQHDAVDGLDAPLPRWIDDGAQPIGQG